VILLPFGPRALLAEFASIEEVMATAAAWRRERWPGVIDIVPAARTVLVVHDGTLDSDLLTPSSVTTAAVFGPLVEVPVRYEGPDLEWVADQTGLAVDEVVRLHTSTEFTCAFCGFMPGFSYLVGLPAVLHLARRSTPRTRVATGAVAIASEFAAVYPAESPGGWHLLGTTDMSMWNDGVEPPATLPPGTRVRFVAT
jgi:KipI family sensor histidine kinase inhibitor